MGDVDEESKTENPTEKRLNDAREEGDVPVSREVPGAAVILAFSVYLTVYGKSSIASQSDILQSIPDIYAGLEEISGLTIISVFEEVMVRSLYIWFPFFLWIIAACLAGSAFQGKLRIVGKRIAVDYSRISPVSGWKRLMSSQGIGEFLKSITKFSIPIIVAYITILHYVKSMELLSFLDGKYYVQKVYDEIDLISLLSAIIFCFVALLDFFWQQFSWWKKLKMSRQQLRDEVRQSEGDPVVKGRLNSLRRERASRRMMRSVPTATMVIANPTHFAVALRYDRVKDPAPVVVATGTNIIALKIRKVAEENEIPVFERVELARALYKSVKINQIIPPQFYRAIAEIVKIISDGHKYGHLTKREYGGKTQYSL